MDNNQVWSATVIDTADGSGDVVIELPNELLTQLDWHEGDTLAITADEADIVRLRKI